MFNSHPPTSSQTVKVPVVIAHGIWDSAATVQPLARALDLAGHTVYCINFLPNDASISLRYYALQLQDFAENCIPNELPFALVGFSMGGLVSALYLQELGGHKRTSHFVPISGPLAGTMLAYGSLKTGVKEMRPTSQLVRTVQERWHLLTDIQMTTIRTPYDAMILPSRSSELDCANNFTVPVAIHAWMLRDARVHKIVASALLT